MRNWMGILAFLAAACPAWADLRGTDENGNPVILRDDGTWSYTTGIATGAVGTFQAWELRLQDADVYEYTYRNWNNANWGQSGSMALGSNVTGVQNTRRRIYLQFDHFALASAVQSGQRILVQLSGDRRDGGTAAAEIYRVTTPWSEGQGTYQSGRVEPTAPPGAVTWMQQPQIDRSRIWARMPLDAPQGPYQADITDLVAAWVRGDFLNHGLVLIGAGEGTARYQYVFVSAENGTPERAPQVIIASAATGTRPTATTPPSGGNLIVNGSFEQGRAGNGLTDGIPGWEITRDTVDVVGPYWQQTDGSLSVDLAGSPGRGRIRQVIQTEPGSQYVITFMMAGHPACDDPLKKMMVWAAGQSQVFEFDASYTTLQLMDWRPGQFVFTADKPLSLISFTSWGENTGCGMALDKVAVEKVMP